MTTSKLLLIGVSEPTQKLIEWVTREHYSLLHETKFTPALLETHADIALIILEKNQSGETLSVLHEQEIPILLLLQPDTLEAYTDSLSSPSIDYITQPFYPQDLLLRIKKNALPPTPQTTVALFDPSEMISQDIRKKWQKLGISIHAFIQDNPLLTFIKSKHPDIVISDASLPTHNAETLIDTLKSREIPLVSLFASYSKQLENNILYSQSDDYSVAPFESEALLLRIKRLIKKKAPHLPQTKLKKSSSPNGVNNTPATQNGNAPALMSQVNVTLNHEIRSPLTSILIGAQVLKKRASEESQEYQIAKEIEDASRRIQNTLDEFGQVKQVVIDDYINGIKMLNLKRSSQSEGTGNGAC